MAEFSRAFGEVAIIEPPPINTTNSRSGSGVRAYPEWDYWKQIVIGSTDLNVVPQPAVGLPLRPHQLGSGKAACAPSPTVLDRGLSASQGYFAIDTSATLLRALSAMTSFPSRVAIIFRTTPPPAGITQV